MKTIFTTILFFIATSISAQVTWNFTAGAAPSSGVVANSTVGSVAQGNNNGTTTLITTTSPSSGYAGSSGTQNAGAASFAALLSTATSTYFEVTITPSPGYNISISSISMGNRSTATGPQLLSVRSSLNAYATDLATAAVSNNSTWALAPFGAFTLATGTTNQAITLRIYASNGAGTPAVNTANWRIDDLAINYAVNVSAINFTSFTGEVVNNAVVLKWSTSNVSNIKNYTIEKSSDGINYQSIATANAKNDIQNNYLYTDGSLNKGVVYYRLKVVEDNGKVYYS